MAMIATAAIMMLLGQTSSAAEKKAQKKAPAKAAATAEPEILKKLLIAINADPDEGDAPHKVKFTVDLYDDDLEKPTFQWNFGDGAVSKEKEPSHVYKKPGDYTVTLRVEDTHDRVGQDDTTIFVNAPGE